jgi:TetR/AcrR family transcriptional regulator, cholesterol catabolism regulator
MANVLRYQERRSMVLGNPMQKKRAVVSKISERRLSARKLAAAEYEKRRAAVLTAAAAVFKELGYGAATVDDVARRAQMDRASVYYYFHGKEDLFREMVGDATAENVEMAERVAQSERSPREKLRVLIQRLFDSYERHYPYLYVYVQEDMSRLLQDKSPWSNKIRALNHRFDVAVVGIIQEGLDRGIFKSEGDAKLLAAGVVGMCNWSHRWFEPNKKYRAADIANAFAEMVIDGLSG